MSSLPGFHAPAVGFEQPFEMLEACHVRVQRTLDLLARLLDHVAQQGHTPDSRSAAQDVLRYFEIAAPAHHEDEERHVFPVLQSEARWQRALQQLQEEHRQMEALWDVLAPVLRSWAQDEAPQALSPALRASADQFQALYAQHIAMEESRVYPAARSLMDSAALQRMSTDMQARRRSAGAASQA